MTRIPTPIPRHLARRARQMTGGGWTLLLWRIVLVVLVVASGALSLFINPTGLAAFVAAGLFLWVFMDDLQATLVDIWNFNFWGYEP